MAEMQRNNFKSTDGEIARVVLELHSDLLGVVELKQLITTLRSGVVLPWSRKTAAELLKIADARLVNAMGPTAASAWLTAAPPFIGVSTG